MECEELEFHSQMKLPTGKSIEAAENARKKMCRMTDHKGSPQNNIRKKNHICKRPKEKKMEIMKDMILEQVISCAICISQVKKNESGVLIIDESKESKEFIANDCSIENRRNDVEWRTSLKE